MEMDLKKMYKMFPTEQSCYDYLERTIWGNVPLCPYCKSLKHTALPKENRYRCNTCKTTYSVTVKTIFHRTRLDFQKWLLAINIILNSKEVYGARQLGRDIEVTKDTAAMILKKIKNTFLKEPEFLERIINFNKKLNEN